MSQLLTRFLPRCLALAAVGVLLGCGSGTRSQPGGASALLSGNWQFSLAQPQQNPQFVGGLSGGFLLQKGNTAQGQLTYSISPIGKQTPCSSGVALSNATLSGQSVTITAIAGVQEFDLTGSISQDGTTMTGTYNATDGQGCGVALSGLTWSATLVPTLTGSVQGSIHSTGLGSQTNLTDQSFVVTGNLVQGPNIGASSATVSGTLSFQGYPCLTTASVSGEVSGNSLVLQLFGINGISAGQIGAPARMVNPTVVSASTNGGLVVSGANAYAVTSNICPLQGAVPGDKGNLCLGVGSTQSCIQPITLTPFLTFPGQVVGAPATTEQITLTNTDPSGATLNGLTVGFQVNSQSDFDGIPAFSEQDNCSNSPGSPFSLSPQQSCTINVSFAPQQACPWIPSAGITSHCFPFFSSTSPIKQTAAVTVFSPSSADPDHTFVVPIDGFGTSVIQPSTPLLLFSAEATGQTSQPQTLSFTNWGSAPVQILPAANTGCVQTQTWILAHPPIAGVVPGFQIAATQVTQNNTTIGYGCDIDPISLQPDFRILNDACSGLLLTPQQSCNLTIQYAPQPGIPPLTAPDYFLQLNTQECTSTVTTDCEIDSGRFPVELKANLPSPLRMLPGAMLDFGLQLRGLPSAPLTLTLFNDPTGPNSQTVVFNSITLTGSAFSEADNCLPSLAPGSSCTINVIYTPSSLNIQQGSITLLYNNGQVQTVYLRGQGDPQP